jgi:hypothetical protein
LITVFSSHLYLSCHLPVDWFYCTYIVPLFSIMLSFSSFFFFSFSFSLSPPPVSLLLPSSHYNVYITPPFPSFPFLSYFIYLF